MKKTGFYAYPSKPTSLVWAINQAIRTINKSTAEIEVTGWEEGNVTGKSVLKKITDAINEADVFLCDLTHINPNVLFELGYAIMSDKPVWISIDKSVQEEEKFFTELGLLTTVDYRTYENGEDLGKLFISDAPFDRLDDTLYRTHVEPYLGTDPGIPSIFYLKSSVSTDSSMRLTRRLSAAKMPLITDDPQEVSHRTLDWYIEKINQSFGVVAHFLDEQRARRFPQNAKYALVSGMAYATGTRLLMLAQSPYEAPVDLRDLIVEHETPDDLQKAVDQWLFEIQPTFENRWKIHVERQKKIAGYRALMTANIGEYVAENEEQSLKEYFIPTSAFEEALTATDYRLFVGRKGTGKTANLYRIAQELQNRRSQNHVCVIKPLDYQLEDVFRLFRIGLGKAERGFLAEVLWKFLVFSELALSVYNNIQDKPQMMWDDDEKSFCSYVDKQDDLIKNEFTTRLENAVISLCEIDVKQIGSEQRKRISEILHENVLSDLRVYLGKLLSSKGKVFILIDNLDKAWEKRHDLEILSQFLFGLLNVGESIPVQFHRSNSRLDKVELTLIVFLRSDIFSMISPLARERDRLKYSRIHWNDSRMLELVIEQRFSSSLEDGIQVEEIWDRFFCTSINNMSTKSYIVEHVVPRPRDIIYFCKQARANAINHKHIRIEEDDILQAEKEYSRYCYDSLLDETQARFEEIEDLMIAFAGSPEIVTLDMLDEYLEYALISSKQRKKVVELLCEVAFLGLETTPNNFEFIYDEAESRIILRKAHRVAKSTGLTRYKINLPYHAFLGIS